MAENCIFCNELRRGYLKLGKKNWGCRVLHSTDNFVVLPALRQIVEGYVIIVPREHVLSIGAGIGETRAIHLELGALMGRVGLVLTSCYRTPIFFEHVAVNKYFRGNCVDHAHMHVVPADIDLHPELSAAFEGTLIGGLDALAQCPKNRSYIFFQDASGVRHVYNIKGSEEGQLLRRMVASKIKPGVQYDHHPCLEKMAETFDKLKGKF